MSSPEQINKEKKNMAWYVDSSHVVTANGTEAVWTTDYDPGATVPQSGIYKCRSLQARDHVKLRRPLSTSKSSLPLSGSG